MRRIGVSSKIPSPPDPASLRVEQLQACRSWLRLSGLSSPAQLFGLGPASTLPLLSLSEPVSTDAACARAPFEVALEVVRSSESSTDPLMLTCEDKDPSVLWVSSVARMALRMIRQFSLFPLRWSIVRLVHRHVDLFYRRLADSALPVRLRGLYNPVSCYTVPYLYDSVKRKCWCDGDDDCILCGLHPRDHRRCTKPIHSCLRNIVSFIRFPSRRLYKDIGRGFLFYVSYIWTSFAFPDLASAFVTISDSISKLQASPRCLRCGSVLEGISLVSADAGQAHEVLKLAFISSVLFRLVHLVLAADMPGYVAVKSQQKSAVYFNPTGAPLEEYRTLAFFDIMNCVFCIIFMRIYRFGNLYVWQREGLPIGGPLSYAVLQCVLASMEHEFRTPEFLAAFISELDFTSYSEALEIPFWVIVSWWRYVDDVFLGSRCLCEDCLKVLISKYEPHITFDPNTEFFTVAPEGYTALKCLDMWVFIPTTLENVELSIFCLPYNPNLRYVLTANSKYRTKFRYSPHDGVSLGTIRKTLYGVLQGRIARRKQCQIESRWIPFVLIVELLN